ncbi:MAG: undecaprenyl-diphosphate phosphatase [Odoribacteraceae bacterium]|jgi:undecaprenyl-diphosphatase|nr:undecaprenyl-diphosphate phosphatase [Odoribacteraceae bacterium]
MDWLQALVLGIIQGITEFLPVSSSGHLQIFGALFGVEANENLTFAITVHAATVCSTIVVLWREVTLLCRGCWRFTYGAEMAYVLKIVLSMIPVAIVGLFFKEQVEALFTTGLTLVGSMLLLTAVLLTCAYRARQRGEKEVSYRDAFIIGLAQACAVLPGLSRSGATITAGLLLGNKKEAVAKFSFLMVLIPILGEALLDLLKGGFSVSVSGISPVVLLIGFASAFVSGAVACRWMIGIVKRGKLIWFALYCALAGILSIVLG